MLDDFKTTLQHFELYPNNIHTHITQIQKNTPSALHNYITHIQHILSNPDAPIISKILSIRFAKDIMILGRNDVVRQLTRLIPYMLKVCTYNQSLPDANRGQTYFNTHPQYTQNMHKQMQVYGSTYFTLCLQSVNKWAKWVPIDQFGNQSVYSRAYNQLLGRGVVFQPTFYYYKNADTDKFKNMYKVQFFTESYMDNGSRVSLSSKGKSDHVNGSSVSIRQLETVQDIRKYMNDNDFMENGVRRYDKLQQIYTKSINILARTYPQPTATNKYLQKLLINYSLLQNKKQNYNSFIHNLTTEQIHINQQSQQFLVSYQQNKQHNKITNNKITNNNIRQQYQQLFKKQQQKYTYKVGSLHKELADKDKQLRNLCQKYQERQAMLREEYQGRIALIKKGVIENSGDKTQYLMQENQVLRNRVEELLGDQQNQVSDNIGVIRELEMERGQLTRVIEILKIENQKLRGSQDKYQYEKHKLITNSNESENNNNKNNTQITQLQQKLKKLQTKLTQNKTDNNNNNKQIQEILYKNNKKINKLEEQLKMYKMQLANERDIHEKEIKKIMKVRKEMEDMLGVKEEKIRYLEKKVDLKDLETAELAEQVRLCKLMDQQGTIIRNREDQYMKTATNRGFQSSSLSNNSANQRNKQANTYSNFGSPNAKLQTSNSPKHTLTPKPLTFKYKKYQTLRHSLPNKEQWYRTVKSTLKNKQIALKQNQLEIGIISQPQKFNKIQFILHFTNLSSKQIDNIQISCQHTPIANSKFKIILQTQFIFCLQPQEQEKIRISCYQQAQEHQKNIICSIYQPTHICIKFRRNQKIYKQKFLLPYFMIKAIELINRQQQCKQIIGKQQQYVNKFIYSHTVLPENKYIGSYFIGIKKINVNKYEGMYRVKGVENVQFMLKFQFVGDGVMKVRLVPISLGQNGLGEEVFRDVMSFIQFAFRK